MANAWFRLYVETIHDPKVLILPEALRWRYVALLCLHCDGKYYGKPDDEISLALRITEEQWIETRNSFVKRELLSPDFKISAWEKRQYISDIKDPTAAERQQRYRDKRNAHVTSRLPEADTDTDTDKKENNNSQAPNVLASEKPKRKKKPKLPEIELPEGWKPHDAHRTKCRNLGFDSDELAEEFRNNHLSKDNRFADWDRAFFTWIGNAKKFSANRPTGKPFNGKPAYGDSIAIAANTVLDHIRREEDLRAEEVCG